MTDERKARRIVILGGGVAGIELATALGRRCRKRAGHRRRTCSVTLVDHAAAHVWKPMLHTIAAGTSDVSQQQTAYLAQARAAGFWFRPGEFGELRRAAHEVRLLPLRAPDGRVMVPEQVIGYDTLVLAVGSMANDFGTPGVRQHCWTIDALAQAEAFNREVRLRIVQCLTQDVSLPIAIVGGGATGVELAAALVQLAGSVVAYGGRGLAERLSITLIEAGPRLLPAFPEDISSAVRAALEAIGVKVLTATPVTAVEADGLRLGAQGRIGAALMVWAAGVKAADFLGNLDGLEANRNHQLVVTPTLATTRDPDVYALGDCSSLTPAGAARSLPPTAQVAHQEAGHLARHLPDALERGVPMPAFAYRDFGSLVSLADYDAFGSLGQFGLFKGVTLRGRIAHLSHVMLYRSHQATLHGFWRGSLLWLVDRLNAHVRPKVRLA